MTSERSKRRDFLSLSFITKSISKKLLSKICILEHLSRLIDFGIQECNFYEGSFSCKFVFGVVIVYLFNELHYVFSDYIMKMLAKGTATFVHMAVPCVCRQFFPANWNKFSCRNSLSAC